MRLSENRNFVQNRKYLTKLTKPYTSDRSLRYLRAHYYLEILKSLGR